MSSNFCLCSPCGLSSTYHISASVEEQVIASYSFTGMKSARVSLPGCSKYRLLGIEVIATGPKFVQVPIWVTAHSLLMQFNLRNVDRHAIASADDGHATHPLDRSDAEREEMRHASVSQSGSARVERFEGKRDYQAIFLVEF